MKKRVILVDGNNLLFRSYYATAYNGNLMKNSKGVPTNALYGFINMINKIINEENPEYIMIAFDKGHNFRQDMYDNYKDGRIETPHDLKVQFPIAKELCELLGIKYIEIDNYEADDIIGTFSKMASEDEEYNATIISSDKDLLQLISKEVDVKLLKQKDYIIMNEKTFLETYGIKPIRMIDLKALMGDASDNIPGVKGIGEKTALSLLQKYDTLDGVYEHIDEISNKTKEKLLNDKENAYFSYKLATIYKEIDFNYTFDSIKYLGPNIDKLVKKYKELEFNSFLKNIHTMKTNKSEVSYEEVKGKLDLTGKYSFYLELSNINYNNAKFIGAAIYDGDKLYYFDNASLLLNKNLLNNVLVTFDNKKNNVFLNKYHVNVNSSFDTLIASYLLEYNVKDDLSYLSNSFGIQIPYYDNIINMKNPLSEDEIKTIIVTKAKFLYDTYNEFNNKLKQEEMYDLYYNIEHPLIEVLTDMEINGISVDSNVINELKLDVKGKVDELTKKIYSLAGEEFNISSPKQLADIIYNKLNIPKTKKNNISTAHDVLLKLSNYHPIINYILEYRNLNKLLTTYLETFNDYILDDGKIHTIYKQTGTRTGRLSSIEPNLQNIPVRSEEGKNIRKAFLPSDKGYLLSSDYSQIELRILAHISNCTSLINAFKNNEDIHTHIASDIFSIEDTKVTPNMRRTAKAVIFGIVYGISGYGLGENLSLSASEAKKYIDKYLSLYPEVNYYMTNIVNKTRELGYVRTLFNRKRSIEEIKNTNYLIRSQGDRMALNTPIQGTSADLLKMAMIKIFKELKKGKYKTKMLLQVHDELIFDVRKDELESVTKLIKDTMENIYKLSVPLKVGISYGKNWYEAK